MSAPPRPQRTTAVRALRVRAARLPVEALERHLASDSDPLALAPLTRAAWARRAMLVRPASLLARVCRAVARDLYAAPRATPWSAWLAARVDAEAERLRAEDPRLWRAVPSEPSAFEQAVASSFGVADDRAAALIQAFHALAEADRAAVHALLPRALFGLPETPRGPKGAARRATGDPRRARASAAHGMRVLRQLLASLRADPR